jgi:hypothetical protein
MTGFVKIKNGTYRNQAITNEVFPLVKQYQLGSKGGFITVDGTGRFGKDKIRVTVANPKEYELVDATEYTGEVATTRKNTQTDEQRIAKSDFVVENADTETAKQQIDHILKSLYN